MVKWKQVFKDTAITAGTIAVGYGITNYMSNRGNKNKQSSDSGKSTPQQNTGTGEEDTGSGTGAISSSSSSSSFTRANASSYAVQSADLIVPDYIYSKPEQYSIQRLGLEVYETDEDAYQPYFSSLNERASDNTKFIDVEDPNITSQGDESGLDTENDFDTTSFKLHRGEILDTFYYDDMSSMNFESDYKEMTDSGTLNKHKVNLAQFYKGVRVKVLSEWEAPLQTLQWENLEPCMEGWIVNQTFKEEEVEVKLTGLSVLLEQNLSFKFRQLPRSRILYEILLTAGLVPWINVTGLDDDITDFTNIHTNKRKGDVSSNQPIGNSSGKIGALAQQLCQGKDTDLEKAKTIHNFIANHVEYPHPNYSNHHKCPTQVLKSGLSNCCDRARLGHEMANAVGLYNRGVHGPGHVWIQYKIKGKWIDSDPGSSRGGLGSVWKGMSADSVWTFPSC